MQAGAQAAVQGIHAVAHKVASGVGRAEKANQAIQAIGSSSRQAVEMVGDISDAIREQSIASELAHLSREMQRVVAQYRV